MAVISIPTSIAGVSVPGLSPNAPNGPLAALYSNSFGTDILHYPRDLNSAQKGHVVQFSIQDIIPASISDYANQADTTLGDIKSSYKNGTILSSIGNGIVNGATAAYNGISTAISAAPDAIDNFSISNSLTSVQNFLSNAKLNFNPPLTNTVASISLYMPETVNFSYEAQYNTLSIIDAAKSASKLVGAIASGLQNQAVQAALYKGGYVLNPQQQLLFESIDFREYEMEFVFTPYSAQEATTVNNIIKAFRRAAAPTIVTEAAGMFFTPPSVIQVDFKFNGNTNPNLNKIKKSVLTSVTVDYAPNGWAAMADGQPVQTKLSLKFREMELVDRAAVNEGY